MAGEQLDLEAIAKRDQELNSSSRMVSAFSQQAAPADRRSLLAEVRRLRAQIEARDRALDDVMKFMEWRAERRAVERD